MRGKPLGVAAADPILIAVDPGVSGAFVWSESGRVHVVKMPPTPNDIADLIRSFAAKSSLVELHLENPSKGGWGAVSSDTIGKLFEQIGGIRYSGLVVGWKVNLVAPQTWQAAIGLKRNRKETRTDWKNRLKQKAETLFPDHPVTLWNADALLLYHLAARRLI
jgi:hypothetical protein